MNDPESYDPEGWMNDPEISVTPSSVTPRVKRMLILACKEADSFRHNLVGPEHLLLGLIKLGQGDAVEVLQKMGLDLETVRLVVEKQVDPGPTDQKLIGNTPYTPHAQKVLLLADKERKKMSYAFLCTHHILIGLLLGGDAVAARALRDFGADIEKTRMKIKRQIDPYTDPGYEEDDRGIQFSLSIKGPKGVESDIGEWLEENGAVKDRLFTDRESPTYSTSGSSHIAFFGELDNFCVFVSGPIPPDQSVVEMHEKLTTYVKKHYTLLPSLFDPVWMNREDDEPRDEDE